MMELFLQAKVDQEMIVYTLSNVSLIREIANMEGSSVYRII